MNDETPDPAPPRRPRRWLRREAINLGDFVVQIIAVVIGILLALLINRWNTQRLQQSAVNDALHAIHSELIANRAALHKSATYLYQRSERMLDSPRNRNKPPRPCYLWDQWGGTGAVNLTDAAYQTAIATQALAHMPFQQAQQIAQIYGEQRIARKSFWLMRTNILIAGPHTLEMCVSAIHNFVANEHNLNHGYAAMIGPDQAKWPTPPPRPPLHPTPSK